MYHICTFSESLSNTAHLQVRQIQLVSSWLQKLPGFATLLPPWCKSLFLQLTFHVTWSIKQNEALKTGHEVLREQRSSYSLIRHWSYQRSQKLDLVTQVKIPIKAKWAPIESGQQEQAYSTLSTWSKSKQITQGLSGICMQLFKATV